MIATLTAGAIVVGIWVVWTAVSFLRSYRAAKITKLPIITSPTKLLNPLWILAYRLYPLIIPLLQCLPFGLGRWVRCSYYGWQFDDKHAIHHELGPASVHCSPGGIEVVVADATAAHSILAKRKDFVKPALMYDALNIFGKNVDTVEGEVWQRHRKITAPNFNERVSAAVWSEGVRQTNEVLQKWDNARDGTTDLVSDIISLTLNVFTYAGFGLQHPFKDVKTKVDHPHRMTYKEALHGILRNYTLLSIVPMAWLKSSILPQDIQSVGYSCDEFKLYMKEMVQKEKSDAEQSQSHDAINLLSALVRASHAQRRGLSDGEIYGNLFIYNLAGHESTANTVATSIAYLAAAPNWQNWLCDEMRAVAVVDGPLALAYESTFSRLKRCQAFMLETLRLHSSIVFVPKATLDTPQTVRIGETEHVIPPNSFVTVNSQAIHCDPEIWGEDALAWRPDRWIVKQGQPGHEELIDYRPGSFVS